MGACVVGAGVVGAAVVPDAGNIGVTGSLATTNCSGALIPITAYVTERSSKR